MQTVSEIDKKDPSLGKSCNQLITPSYMLLKQSHHTERNAGFCDFFGSWQFTRSKCLHISRGMTASWTTLPKVLLRQP